ncbi:MAG TPA: YbhB/YbcL family Raf kinase inhibitor-like protein [Vicinamibacterales bacterium]|nr:YbhB/YbcL family Raf kinase inhibitor-like protein [Vicinamibacterales bacterium]
MRLARLLPVVVLGLATASLFAQNPPPAGQQTGQQAGQRGGGAPGQPPQPGQPGQRGGRGGGRGAIAVMTLTTTAWTDGAAIPLKYSQAGEEVSPPLAWTNAPDNAVSFVLIVHDPDAGIASQTNGADDVLHWMVWNIPATTKSLPEAVPQGPQLPDGTRQISQTGPYYRGPAAPATGPAHHYLFEIFALDATLDVEPVGKSPAETRAAVVAAMAGHVRGRAALVGTFRHGQ